jgi:hypothetical protein
MRINKPVKPDVIQKIEALAGSRGLEMIKNSDGETVFLIGNFITFESAMTTSHSLFEMDTVKQGWQPGWGCMRYG